MTGTILQIQTFAVVREGMRVNFASPRLSTDDHDADVFFRRYHDQDATIVGFPTEAVGILDNNGRLPGMYLTGGINIRFDGEETVHTNLNIRFFILLESTETTTTENFNTTRRVCDLPNPILFYPGDTVCKKEDLLREHHLVQRVYINGDNEVGYQLQNAEARSGAELELISRGKLYYLYSEPDQLTFDSEAEELLFWSRDGLSKTVETKHVYGVPRNNSWAKAWKLYEEDQADLIVEESREISRVLGAKTQEYSTRRLHECFASFRDRVRSLTKQRELISIPE